LEEKVGQMILARSDGVFLHENNPDYKALEKLVAQGRVGGVVFFRGEPFSTATLANHLQDAARHPLLMASDYEWGAAFRVEGTTRFPTAMAVSAGGDEADARFQAEVTAREARAMGIHLALAPVVDINLNPANSVINTRSYGEDPVRAGRLAAAFIRRAQEKGLLTAAKHFPGHGATTADSHVTLPVVELSRERVESVGLEPFRAAVDAGVAAVMTAHVAVPALDGKFDRPATFSPEILTGILRNELGFDGLIISDALDMGGVERWWGGEIAVAAVLAGVDLLAVPSDAQVAWDALVRAVGRGDIPVERIDRSVLRILEAKARLNLHRQRIVDLRDLPRRIGDPRFVERVQGIANRAVTLLENREGLLPLPAERAPSILLVSYTLEGDRIVDSSILEEEIEKRTESSSHLHLTSASGGAQWDAVGRRAEAAEVVVLASYARARSSLGRGNLNEKIASTIDALNREGKRVVFVSLGSPYVLTEFPGASARLALYDFSEVSQRAAAKALFGEISVSGKLPVTLSARFPAGHGLELRRRSLEWIRGDSPEEVGFSRGGLRRAVRVLNEAVRSEVFPGGIALVGKSGKIVLERPFGRLRYDREAPEVTVRTLYDLASLTKVVATTTLAMIFYERGELVLERPVRRYLPEFNGGDKDRVTVADLLAHCSGLKDTETFFKEYGGLTPGEAKNRIVRSICEKPLEYEPRSKTVYSDLGFILLGEILERVSGRPFDELARDEVFAPLEMTSMIFNPPPSLRDSIAPTEDDLWRGRLVWGEVHDENAFVMGGVAPHAGLFSTGYDLARFAQAMLNGGIYGTHRILKRSTIERFTQRAALVPESARALGWDTPSPPSSSGQYFSAMSFGHLGFTGTSLWIDPEREIFVVLLTNRVHPTRDNRRIRDVRPAFHDAVMEALLSMRKMP
jgi:beta-glucosidase-like glycosyl hydrolase/CubicO group peptidase (beta-lactamase class C family)